MEIKLPAFAASYHKILLPVTAKFATVAFAELQNPCDAVPAGADGVTYTVAVTWNLVELSQVLVVWLA